MEDIIDIIVTETTNTIEITSQASDELIDVNIIDNREDITLNVTPTLVEININSLTGNFGVEWGDITGTLADQEDLQDALDLKADLVGGKVPSSQLPSYVDDIVEVATYSALPATGETGKIYVVLDTNKIYRWSGSAYIEIADSTAVWGAITGTLFNQTDLQNALNAKFDDPTGDTTQYIAGDGSLITFPVAGQAGTLVREVRNTTGSTITKGTVVYISGATGNKPTISKALATSDSTSAQTFGLAQADISNNSNGYVVCVGDLTGIDTSALTEGQQLYLSSTTAGAYTTTKQLAPAHLVYIGVVTRSHPTLGQIEVKIQNGYELDEIHDVAISSVANNESIFWESSTSLWKNKSIATVLGYSPEQPLTFSSPLSRSTNTVSIPASSGSQNGYLSSTDWTTFNSKQAALSGTGFVKISGTTISYDNTSYLPLTGGTLTGAVTGTRLTLVQNSSEIALSIVQSGTGSGLSVLGKSYFSSDISFGSFSNGILKANALGALVLATAGTDYQAPLSGTGFVKVSGSTISYDNSTYALDSAVVKLTGDQNIDGNKEFILPTTFRLGIGLKNPDGIYNYISSINSGWKINTNNKEHQLLFSTSTAYTYTFPSATGTIAITSDLASYLPLSGGTLTGALNGTSALFSGAVRANNPSEGATGEGLIAGQSFKIDGTGTSQKAVMYMVSNVLSDTYASGLTAQFANFAGDKGFGFNLNTSGGYELYVKNTTWNKALTIANTGAATFSSSVNAGGAIIATKTTGGLLMGITNAVDADIVMEVSASGAATKFGSIGGSGASNLVLAKNGGNVGIGTATPTFNSGGGLNITNASAAVLRVNATGYTGLDVIQGSDGTGYLWNRDNNDIRFGTNNAERMRINTDGFLKVSNTGTYNNVSGNYHEFNNSIAGQNNTIFRTSSSTDSYGPWIYFSNQTPNNTTNYFLAGTDSTNDKFFIYSNGSMYNKTGTYGTISDIKYKENIVDATSKLEDISKLKVRNFNFKGDSTKQLGFIAQEFEEVFPNMIDISKESGENGESYKAIKTSVLVPMLVKAIQELKTELDTLKNK